MTGSRSWPGMVSTSSGGVTGGVVIGPGNVVVGVSITSI